MFKSWVCRILSVVFLLDILAPIPSLAQEVPQGLRAPAQGTLVPSFQDITRQIQQQTSAWTKPGGIDEMMRAKDPYRQTDLAKEIVMLHAQGIRQAGGGRVVQATRAARQEVNRVFDEEHGQIPTGEAWRDQKTFVSDHGQYGDNTNPRKPTSDLAAVYEETYAQTLFKPLQERIQAPDFTVYELLEYLDPYSEADYDPILTTVAAETLVSWLDIVRNNYSDDPIAVEGITVFFEEIEQRVLFRLAKLKGKSVTKLTDNEVRAMGSLRMVLEQLNEFYLKVLVKYPKLKQVHAEHSVFADRFGGGIEQREMNAQLGALKALGKALEEKGVSGESALYNPLKTMTIYAAALALFRDKTGSLLGIDGNQWTTMEVVFQTIESIKEDEKRKMPEVPFGPYVQNKALLLVALASFLNEHLTKEDLSGERGANFVELLKKFAAVNKNNSTPMVVTAAEMAAFFSTKRGLVIGPKDKALFAKAVESVYCRSSVHTQNWLYNANGVKQDLGSTPSSIAGVSQPKMARLFWVDFGFGDIQQHAEFMRGLAKIHKQLGGAPIVYKPVNPRADDIVFWDERGGGSGTVRRYEQLPAGEFYYKCEFDEKYKMSDMMEQKHTGRLFLAIMSEIVLWYSFDWAFTIGGRFIGLVFRSSSATVRTLPQAIRVAGDISNKGRRAGAFLGEIRKAVRQANVFRRFDRAGVAVVAASRAGSKVREVVTSPITRADRLLPGVKAAGEATAEVAGQAAKQATEAVLTETEAIYTTRLWKRFSDVTNRYLRGLGPKREAVETLTFIQGRTSVVFNLAEKGLQNGMTRKQFLGLVEEAVSKGGIKLTGVTRQAARTFREIMYMDAVVAGKIGEKGWLGSRLPNRARYWKYAGKEKGWVQVEREEFMELHELNAGLTKHANSGTNYYDLLGVPRNATQGEIKAAFRRAALKTHPDRAGKAFEELNKQINEAYDVLRNPFKRAKYDRLLRQARIELPESAEGLSLGITFNGRPPVRIVNGSTKIDGVVFGSKGNPLGDVMTPLGKYVEETGRYSQIGRRLAGLPSGAQRTVSGLLFAFPAYGVVDYALKNPFQRWMGKNSQQEQEGAMSRFSNSAKQLEAKAADAASTNTPEFHSMYDQVKSIPPQIVRWLGLPCLDFFGSAFGWLLFATIDDLHKKTNGLTPSLVTAQLWMSKHMVGEDMGDPLGVGVENARYQLASTSTKLLLRDRVQGDAIKRAMAPYNEMRADYMRKIPEQLGQDMADVFARDWDALMEEFKEILATKPSKKPQRKEGSNSFAKAWNSFVNLFTAKQEEAAEGEENPEQKRLLDTWSPKIADLQGRIMVLLSYENLREKYFKNLKTALPKLYQEANSVYDNFMQECKSIYLRKLSAKQTQRLASQAFDRMNQRVDSLVKGYASNPANATTGAVQMNKYAQLELILQPQKSLDNELTTLLGWGEFMLPVYLQYYDPSVTEKVDEFVSDAIVQIREIDPASFSEKKQQDRILQIKKDMLKKITNCLDTSEINLLTIYKEQLMNFQYNTPTDERFFNEKLDWVEEEWDRLAAFEIEISGLSAKDRSAKVRSFVEGAFKTLAEKIKRFGMDKAVQQ